ncbi:MAG: PSD1 and planctomycete cytochrome C domain-containing protein [Gemmatales bacterium]
MPSRCADDAIDFNRQIRPILSDKCYQCHGPDEKHRKAGLRLDVESSAKSVRKGREAIVPGDIAKSQLIARITSEDRDERMPPHDSVKQLTVGEIDLLRRWIVGGAKWGEHWAYLSPQRAPRLYTIDLFIQRRLVKENLTISPNADSTTLLRRLYFDLIGLPPTPDDLKFYTRDRYEEIVDKLLAKPQFGERMAVYWLDLVRYADTVGYHGDQDHHASPYRDYVIDAFNRNMSFDQFTKEQLAGDLLPNSTIDQRIATCYNRLLQTSHEGGVQAKEYLAIYAADRVRNVSTVWMGATVGCAQCHDHKYDPYTAKDFYALSAFFADVDEEKHLHGGGGDTVPTKRPPEIPVLSRAQREQMAMLDMSISVLEEGLKKATPNTKEALEKLLKSEGEELAALQKATRKVMVTQAVTPRPTRLLPRGNWLDETGPLVEPAVPEFMGKLAITGPRANRLDLANWLTDSKTGAGGLTARVFVNRIWSLFFGNGLSRSMEDFGNQGEAPTHPELLDNLTVEFIESGWDVKKLIKQIVMSQTYRQSSFESAAIRERDPENRLLSHQSRYRLPAEMVRDNALFVSGLLVLDHEGSSVKPYQPAGYYQHLNFPKREYKADTSDRQWHRGVYVHWQRQYLHPMLRAFDAPTREECTVRRQRSNTPQAALVLMNDPTFLEAARAFAQRIINEPGKTDEERVQSAFRQALTRLPDPQETATLLAMLKASRQEYQTNPAEAKRFIQVGLTKPDPAVDAIELAAWMTVTRTILNLSEMTTRN